MHFGLPPVPPSLHLRQRRVLSLFTFSPSQRAHFSLESKKPFGHPPRHISGFSEQFRQLLSVQGTQTADYKAYPPGHVRALVTETPTTKMTINVNIDPIPVHVSFLPHFSLLSSSVAFLEPAI